MPRRAARGRYPYVVTTLLSAELLVILDHHCELTGRSRSDLVREALVNELFRRSTEQAA